MNEILMLDMVRAPYDDLAHYDVEYGLEWWDAREMMLRLGYSNWQSMQKLIDRVRILLKNSGLDPSAYIVQTTEPTKGRGKGGPSKMNFLMARRAINVIAITCHKHEARNQGKKDQYGAVYFLLSRCNNLVKIGFTARDINEGQRLRIIRSMSPVPLDFLGSVDGCRSLEMELHAKFQHLRDHGEWFQYTEELAGYIQELFASS